MSTLHITTEVLEEVLDLPEEVHITGAAFEEDQIVLTLTGVEAVSADLVDKRVVLHYETDFDLLTPTRHLKGISASPED